MRMIKINTSVYFLTLAVKNKAKALNSQYNASESGELKGLSTVVKYLEQEKQIKKLINNYKNFAIKDAEDLDAMFTSLLCLDSRIHDFMIFLR